MPPPDGPAPLAPSDSMYVNVSGTAPFLGGSEVKQGPAPIARGDTNTADYENVSPTIRSDPNANPNGQTKPAAEGDKNNEAKSILEYDRTLRPLGKLDNWLVLRMTGYFKLNVLM